MTKSDGGQPMSRDEELQELLDAMTGHLPPAAVEASRRVSEWRFKQDRAMDEINEKSRRLVSLSRKIFKRFIHEYCEITFWDHAYMTDHSQDPPKISPHIHVSVRRSGWVVEKNFWPRHPRHIEQTAKQIRGMLDFVGRT